MKQVCYGVVSILILFLIVVAILTVDGRTARENQLDNTASASVKELLGSFLVSREGVPKTDEEMEEKLIRVMRNRTDATERTGQDKNYSLTVEVKDSDVDLGLLSCEVTESYSHPNGRVGTTKRTVTGIIEQEEPLELYSVRFLIEYENGNQEIYGEYYLEEGSQFPNPGTPYVEGKSFYGWFVGDRRIHSLPDTVESDATYVAKFL